MDDMQLTAEVRQQIDGDPRLDGLAITLQLSDGSVTLLGELGSSAERLLVVALVSAIPGVQGMVNRLTVRPCSTDWRLTDEQLATRVTAAIAGLPGTRFDGIAVAVEHRVVTLTGSVPDSRSRALIRHSVEQVPGVSFIINNLGVVLALPAHEEALT